MLENIGVHGAEWKWADDRPIKLNQVFILVNGKEKATLVGLRWG
jgi:hypothetical protein